MKKIFALLVVLVLFSSVAMAEPLIQRGDYGEEVVQLHTKLRELGLYNLRPESPWSSVSEDALKVLQGVMGLEETGSVADQNELEKILAFEHEPFSRGEIAASRIVENLFTNPELSAGATSTDDGYVFTTDLEGNAFNAVQWQLLNSNGEYIETFDSKGTGFSESDYVFSQESGEYMIRLKANSNKKDEGARTTVNLEQGQTYHFIYDVVSLEEQQVEVNGVAFGVKR